MEWWINSVSTRGMIIQMDENKNDEMNVNAMEGY